jgi:uncharacterized membrane protein YcaP (DUF421 family)
VAVNSVLVRLVQRSDLAVAVVEGTREVLVRDGRVEEATLERLGLRSADVIVALRRQGASTLQEVAEATLEPGGSIVVTLHHDAENATKADITRLEAKLDQLLARQ